MGSRRRKQAGRTSQTTCLEGISYDTFNLLKLDGDRQYRKNGRDNTEHQLELVAGLHHTGVDPVKYNDANDSRTLNL